MPEWTVIGNLASDHDVLVDPRGRLMPWPGGWTLDWWVGASDRWHLPSEEGRTAVAQHRPDGTPVVETSLRVPTGQVVHRAWCVTDRGADVVMVELENRSREPLAVALVVDGARTISFGGERAVSVDGMALALGRVPARVASGGDVRPVVTAGDAPATAPFDRREPAAAFVFPLAHTARLRVALPLTGGSVDPDRLPDADTVVGGWRAHVDAGARIAVPEVRLATDVVATRTTLLLRSDRPRELAAGVAVASALDAWGHHEAAAAALRGVEDHQRLDGWFGRRGDSATTAAVLAAWGAHARATGDATFAGSLAGPAAKAAHRLGRAHRNGAPPAWFAVAQLDAADLLDVAGQTPAAALCRERAAGGAAPTPTLEPASNAGVITPQLGAGSPDDGEAVAFLLGVRQLLVDDAAPAVLRLLPRYPDAWLGQEVEAHRLPTRAGLLSFAVRWHGARPALLWQLGAAHPARISVPGLDHAWSTTEPAGEALLSPVEPAGGLPKVVAPLAGDGTPVDEVPDDGVSFQ